VQASLGEIGVVAPWFEADLPRPDMPESGFPGSSGHTYPWALYPESREGSSHPVATAIRRLAADERYRRRKAAHGERRVAVPCLEFLGGVAVGGDEEEVGVPQLAANGAAGGVDGRRGRPLGLEGAAFRILGQDGGGAEDLDAGALPAISGFPVDLRRHRGGELLPLLRRQMLPARERSELQGLAGRILIESKVFSPPASVVLLSAVEPPAFESGPLRQGLDAVDSRPIREAFDQTLFDPVAENVAESRNLGFRLVADQDRPVASSEDLLSPAGEAPDLPGELGGEVAHEAGELLGVVDLQEKVAVVGEEHEGADPHRIELLGPGEGSEDQEVEPRPGPEEEAAVERPEGHLDQGARVWDEANGSAHAQQ
jgi:hypothetical protein